MDRKGAIAVLRELLRLELIHPSWVSLNNAGGKFSLMLKDDCSNQELKEFLLMKNLFINEEKGYCVISK